jgi:hypothetical protein
MAAPVVVSSPPQAMRGRPHLAASSKPPPEKHPVTTPHGYKRWSSGMIRLCRPTVIVRFMHASGTFPEFVLISIRFRLYEQWGVFETVFNPGAQAIGIADRFLDLPVQISHDVPGALRRQRPLICREVVVANPAALSKDDLADVPGLVIPVGEDALKRSEVSCSARVGLTATRRHGWNESPPRISVAVFPVR